MRSVQDIMSEFRTVERSSQSTTRAVCNVVTAARLEVVERLREMAPTMQGYDSKQLELERRIILHYAQLLAEEIDKAGAP